MKTNEERLQEMLGRLDQLSHIRASQIPEILLYMDQVTTFMAEHLKDFKRNDGDKVLTKTMINNYAKNHLLPPPDRKKYSKEHILLLIYIYYYKGILSIGDIEHLLEPLTERFFHTDKQLDMQAIYQEVFSLEKAEVERLKEEVVAKYKLSSGLFPDAEDGDRQFLQIFSFICLLSFDVYVKKQVIEKLIDQLPQNNEGKKHHKE